MTKRDMILDLLEPLFYVVLVPWLMVWDGIILLWSEWKWRKW